MRRLMAFIFVLICVLCLTGCGKKNTHEIAITIPAGSREPFVFSEEEICPTGRKITVSCGEGLGDTEVMLTPVNELLTPGYVATYLTPGVPVEFDTDQGQWLKIGISMQNPTDTDITVYIAVKGVEVRIS